MGKSLDIDYYSKPSGYYSNRQDMLSFVPSDAKFILDVGCGEGDFGLLLKRKLLAEVWGVEIFEKAAKIAMAKIDHVIVGDIEDQNIALPKNHFDCIIFNDCLEHLKDPWSVLGRIRGNLKDNGCVVASIPNIRYFPVMIDLIKNRQWCYVEAGILDKTHLRFFTINSIKDLFQSAGYCISRLEGLHSFRFPGWFSFIDNITGRRFDDMKFLQFACLAYRCEL